MKTLSISQSYLLCVLNKKGKLPMMSSDIPVCVVAGGLLDLAIAGHVALEDKKIRVTGELSEELKYLDSLYGYIKKSGSITLDKVAMEYCFSLGSNKLMEVVESIGETLVTEQCAFTEKGGIFGKTVCFVPDSKEVDRVIQNIRAEILEDGVLSDEVIALTSLMEKSGQIKRYFSKYEKFQLKKRLEEVKKGTVSQMVEVMLDAIGTMIAVIAVSGASH